MASRPVVYGVMFSFCDTSLIAIHAALVLYQLPSEARIPFFVNDASPAATRVKKSISPWVLPLPLVAQPLIAANLHDPEAAPNSIAPPLPPAAVVSSNTTVPPLAPVVLHPAV